MALTSNLKFAARRFGYGTLILGTLLLYGGHRRQFPRERRQERDD